MNVFDDYARYYDLLYKDKEYRSEVDYINSLIKKHLPNARTILDLGCGTGNHDQFLADLGYMVTGVDCSSTNLAIAKQKLENSHSKSGILQYLKGDVRSLQLNHTFDVVISLFHVMSYQISNNDFKAAIQTAKSHLKKGGLFIFDCWYGPAVLNDPPQARIKCVEDDKHKVVRIADPELISNKNLVKVNYQLIIQKKDAKEINEIFETHRMRYFFLPEIEYFLEEIGFRQMSCSEWMTTKSPGCDTWNVHFINMHI